VICFFGQKFSTPEKGRRGRGLLVEMSPIVEIATNRKMEAILMPPIGRIVLFGLVLATNFSVILTVKAEHVAGVVVNENGKPIPWTKDRVFNPTTNQYTTVLIPSVQIELWKTNFKDLAGRSNADLDGTIIISWDKKGPLEGEDYCILRFIRKSPNVGSPESSVDIKLKLTAATIDPNHPENIRLREPIVLRHPDESLGGKGPGSKGKGNAKGKGS
jgi:hypothetical protein